MIIFDYRRDDFREVKTDNEKKYFIKVNNNFIEVSIEIFRIYKTDYMKMYRLYKHSNKFFKITYEEEFMMCKGNDNLDMNKLYIDQIYKKEFINNLYKAMNYLNKDQYYIIFSLYFEEKSECEVAKELNISQQALNKRKRKILLSLKKRLAKYQKM